jgi:uncharacterized membrane protein
MALAIVAAHLLDFGTFMLAIEFYGIPISAERNAPMAAAYNFGGMLLVLAQKAALISIALYLLNRVREKPLWPPFLLIYGLGLLGTTANMLVIHGIW